MTKNMKFTPKQEPFHMQLHASTTQYQTSFTNLLMKTCNKRLF